MQSTTDNAIYLTQAVADHFGIEANQTETRTLDEFIEQTTGKTKLQTPIYETQPDTSVILGSNPINSNKLSDPNSVATYTPVANSTIDINNYLNSNDTIGISSAEDFELLLTNDSLWDKNLILQTDVDLTGVNWTGIGTETKAFTGNFNGNGHTISNLTMNTGTYGYALFGFVEGGTIENIAITNANVTSTAGDTSTDSYDSYVGCLIGKATDATIKNCQITNSTVSGKSDAALLVGHTTGNSNISNCYVSGTVNTSVADAGGITGELAGSSSIKNCVSDTDVNNTSYNYGLIGGIAGKNAGTGTITNCNATGNLNSNVPPQEGIIAGGGHSSSSSGPDNNSVNINTAESSWNSQIWNKGSNPTLKTQESDDYITVETLLSGAQTAIIIPPLNSIASNIYYAFDKAGITGINETTIYNWLNTNFGTNNSDNNKKLASINDYLNEFLTSASTSSTFVNALSNDIKLSTTTSSNSYTKKYLSNSTITAQRGYDDEDCIKNVANYKGQIKIPTINTIATNIYGAIQTNSPDKTITLDNIKTWLNSKFGSGSSSSKLTLANINALIEEISNNKNTNNLN